MANTNKKTLKRETRHARIRAKIEGTKEMPRLCVYKSNKYIYAQLIDDLSGTTLAAASSMKSKGTMMEGAKEVGKEIAELAKKINISKVAFDRGGFIYTGKIKVLADAAREAGLTF
ncbi:MAG: 50S ribosomal protein L18 [bacterium]